MLVPQGPAVPARAAETPAKESQEKERKDDGRERPKGVHLKDNPGKKNSQQRALGKTADLEGEDMPGRGLSGHGGGESEMDTERQTKTVRRLPAWLGCCPELPLSLTAAFLLLADTLIRGGLQEKGRGLIEPVCSCVYTPVSVIPSLSLCVS